MSFESQDPRLFYGIFVSTFLVFPILVRLARRLIIKYWLIGAILCLIETRALVYLLPGRNQYSTVLYLIVSNYLGTLAIDLALVVNLFGFKKILNSTTVFISTFLTAIALCYWMLDLFYRIDFLDLGELVLYVLGGLFCCSITAACHVLVFKKRLDDVDNEIRVGDCFYLALTVKLDACFGLPIVLLSKLFGLKRPEEVAHK